MGDNNELNQQAHIVAGNTSGNKALSPGESLVRMLIVGLLMIVILVPLAAYFA